MNVLATELMEMNTLCSNLQEEKDLVSKECAELVNRKDSLNCEVGAKGVKVSCDAVLSATRIGCSPATQAREEYAKS